MSTPYIVLSLWILLALAGFSVLIRHNQTPGLTVAPPQKWPESTRLAPNSRTATLVMFIHPRCPCTRAGLTELSRLLTACQNRLSAYVVVLKPNGCPDGWEKTDSWYRAQSIPGVSVVADPDGLESNRFRATTSGATLLYNPKGELMFHGGITAGRGHEGDNLGMSAIESLVNDQKALCFQTNVYGCSLK
jgi:hypothetical protein